VCVLSAPGRPLGFSGTGADSAAGAGAALRVRGCTLGACLLLRVFWHLLQACLHAHSARTRGGWHAHARFLTRTRALPHTYLTRSLPHRAVLVQGDDMGLMVLVENVFASRAQWSVEGQQQGAPWCNTQHARSNKHPPRGPLVVCLIVPCAEGVEEASRSSDPFEGLLGQMANAQPGGGGGGGGGSEDCTCTSYSILLPRTDVRSRSDGQPGGCGAEGGASRLRAAIVTSYCGLSSKSSAGQSRGPSAAQTLLGPGLDPPLLVFWTD